MRISSKDKILDTLVQIDNNSDSGSFHVDRDIHDNERISLLETRGYIKCNSQGTHYHITESGYSMLQRWYALKATRKLNITVGKVDASIKDLNESSTRLSNENLKHTKTMVRLTLAIGVVTVVNLILLIVQLIRG